jgi:hypothetical protein
VTQAEAALIAQGIKIATAAAAGVASAIKAQNTASQIEAEGRDPTPEEWATLTADIDALGEAIQGA